MDALRFVVTVGLTGLALHYAGPGQVFGQQPQPPAPSQPYQGSAPAVNTNIYGGGAWGGGYRSSTVAGDRMQGMASAISAQGQANLNTSMAARNMEEAYSRGLDNRVKSIETYRWREDSAKQRRDQELAEERARREPYLDQKVRIKELTPQQFDPTTGNVAWPMLCQDPAYDEYRQKLDQLLAKQASYGALTMAEFTETEKVINDWRAAMTADRKKYPTPAVRQAVRFLLSLDKELNAQFG